MLKINGQQAWVLPRSGGLRGYIIMLTLLAEILIRRQYTSIRYSSVRRRSVGRPTLDGPKIF